MDEKSSSEPLPEEVRRLVGSGQGMLPFGGGT
jgi:hypothetical protein